MPVRATRRAHPAEADRLARQARRLVGSVRTARPVRPGVVTVSELGASWAATRELARAGW